jgi:hypothetical protein
MQVDALGCETVRGVGNSHHDFREATSQGVNNLPDRLLDILIKREMYKYVINCNFGSTVRGISKSPAGNGPTVRPIGQRIVRSGLGLRVVAAGLI